MITVPDISGNVIVRSALGSSTAKVVSKSLTEPPSKINGDAPERVPIEVACSPVRFEPSPLNELAVTVPVVVRLSLPKVIASELDPIEPLLKVKSPIEDPEARVETPALNVPDVDKFSFPNEIDPSESVMLPVARFNVPSILT